MAVSWEQFEHVFFTQTVYDDVLNLGSTGTSFDTQQNGKKRSEPGTLSFGRKN